MTAPLMTGRVQRHLWTSKSDDSHELLRGLATHGQMLGTEGVAQALPDVRAALTGAGPLQPLLENDDVTDVVLNGPGFAYVKDANGWRQTDVAITDEAEIRRLAVRLATSVGRRLDEACPFVDAPLSANVRFHAILGSLSPAGTCLSFRVFRADMHTIDDLIANGLAPASWTSLLYALVRQKVSFLISGGTGSGKTTLLRAMVGAVPAHERVVVVEDCAELRPPAAHCVTLEARPANVEGAGSVDMRDLVRQALRMCPDRLVIGECRGAEVIDFLAALNTGHRGGCGTIHANSAHGVGPRMEALGGLAGLTPRAVHSQLGAGIQVVLHLENIAQQRILSTVSVTHLHQGELRILPAVIHPNLTPVSDGRGPGFALLNSLLTPRLAAHERSEGIAC